MSDKELIQLFNDGTLYASDILIEKYKSLLYRLCNKLTKNISDADDLFQDTWLKIFKNLNKYDTKSSFENWMYTICINTYKDKYNKKKRWLNLVKDYFSDDEKDIEWKRIESTDELPEDHIIEKENSDTIKEKVDSLDDKYRIPIILYYFKEFSYNEISEILNIPIGTLKSRLNTGRKILKELLKEVENHEG
ncbi:RNA polymerase sigma factor [Sporosalibacterium faouarense]|uniref:RNA polymerase sigma factor n=1 Tax=Sporosalibacterium faouarense TaxID=516123 RepID=UPI00141C5A2E|nr:sigma-70 family RNA polymerase sigma factor [Sporosalibacterium faouarense]MTI47362.1 sigma-70 family RNA polymerase sigma factor [Bacillota bacterium]